MYDISYVGATHGERIELCYWPYMVNGGDIFNSEFEEVEENDRIQDWEKKITDYSLQIDISAVSKKAFQEAVDRLEDITEKDIVNMTPGKLYVGNSYMKCWIVGTGKDRWLNDLCSISNELTVKSDYPYWITEEKFEYLKAEQSEVTSPWLEFPYDFPYEYAKVRNLQYIQNNNYTASGFKMIIYGPCINPLIRVAGHIYELKTTLYEGEYAVIDSSTRYAKDRKIIKVKADGTQEDIYNSRNKESEIWEKIPPGRSTVSWSGSFGFDIILFNERGTPRWTLR